MFVLAALVGCASTSVSPEQKAIVEYAVRVSFLKLDNEPTKADLRTVKALDLFAANITDAGLKQLEKLEKLEKLELESCKQITDVGLREVAKLKRLSMLDLRNTKVTKAGVAQLQKALPKCKIHSNPSK
jgi:hypothetical protein